MVPLNHVFEADNRTEPAIVVDEFDESEIMYTSGTTGKPKGARFVHHNQMVVTATMLSFIGLQPMDQILLAAPMSHSASAMGRNGCLYCGASQG